MASTMICLLSEILYKITSRLIFYSLQKVYKKYSGNVECILRTKYNIKKFTQLNKNSFHCRHFMIDHCLIITVLFIRIMSIYLPLFPSHKDRKIVEVSTADVR